MVQKMYSKHYWPSCDCVDEEEERELDAYIKRLADRI